jgi:hypothetical protein
MTRHFSYPLLLGCLTIATALLLGGSAAAQGGSKTFDALASFPPETITSDIFQPDCAKIGMTVSGRDRPGPAAEIHLTLGINDYCLEVIVVAATDLGSVTGSSTAVMNDAFRVAPNLKTAWLVTTVPLCNVEFIEPICPSGSVDVDITWTATGPRVRQENGDVCRAAKADATISLVGWFSEPFEYTFQTTQSASLCEPAGR